MRNRVIFETTAKMPVMASFKSSNISAPTVSIGNYATSWG